MKNSLIILSLFLILGSVTAQDTTVIQTFTFSDITERRSWFNFPDDSESYRKIIAEYTLKCDATTTQDQFNCGEWDYLSYNFVYDHTGVLDSNQANHPHYLVGTDGWTDSLHYQLGPYWDYFEEYQYELILDNTINETLTTIGTEVDTIGLPFSGNERVRAQFIWTAAELTSAGMAAGDIERIQLNIETTGGDLANVRIRLKETTSTQLTAFESAGFTEHFYSPVSFPSVGMQYFNFLTPFNWDGSSNMIVEFSYQQNFQEPATILHSGAQGTQLGIATADVDRMVKFDDGKYLQVPVNGYDFGDEITVSFWAYGDADIQPENSYVFEAVNGADQRVLNCHLPWSDGRIYWDAGEGSGYDRIDKAATVAEYEGNWVHWALTKNAATGSMKIYKNGSLWHSGTGLDRSIGMVQRFNIGKGAVSNNTWHGNMDEFRIWDVELDEASIASWMNRTVDSSHPNWNDMVVYYNFDDPVYNNDQSGNGFDAGLVGPPQNIPKSLDGYFMDPVLLSERPVITFIQGTYDMHLDSTIVTHREIAGTRTSLTEFGVQGNSVVMQNTSTVFNGYHYTYHVDGTVDSVQITTSQTMNNDTLWYFQTPFELIDRYEIGRFITPYGIGLSLGPDGFTWKYDVTDYAHLLQDSVDLSAGNQQELIDLKFLMIKGEPMADVVDLSRPWGQSASYSYGNLDDDISLSPVDVDIAPNAENFKMVTRLTGHGHQSNSGNYPHCCEWKDNTHYLDVNGSEAESWHIWQTHDCAQNAVFPQGGTWPGAREGWCPGDVVKDNNFMMTDQFSGSTVNLDYSITSVPSNNQGMASGNYIVAMQLMQYGAAKNSLDAEVYEVISPNNWEYYSRINPYCDDAKIVLRNAGETTLTTVTITYNVDGGQPLTFSWSGSLGFMETEEVVLPIDDAGFWQGHGNGKFIATVSAPNDGQDEYAGNDSYTSTFDLPNVYEGNFVIRYKTNNYPQENYYEILDINGNVVFEKTNSTANTTYMDTMDLAPGCYTFNLYDSEDDGLSYWAWPNQGSGFCRFRENGGGYIQTFEAEFGGQITHGFSIGSLTSVAEPWDEKLIEVYPNPNNGQFTLEMAGLNGKFNITVLNNLGQIVDNRTVNIHEFYERVYNLGKVDSGSYTVRIIGNDTNVSKRIIVQ